MLNGRMRIMHQADSAGCYAPRSASDPAANVALAGARRGPLEGRTLSDASELGKW
jgi:hypothetical protein